jgi:predicted ATPase/DNA-binding XRE family transcriptional regulator
MPPTGQSFAVALKQFRAAHGMTQDELAARSGVSVRSISDLERGISRFPHKDTVQLLADALHLTPEEADHLFALARAPKAPTDALTALTASDSALPLVGRDRELGDIQRRLMDPSLRLLTLTGVAGVGKTRLALESATLARDGFPAGVTFVDLAALSAAHQVLPAIAQALGVREQPARTLLDETIRWIGEQRLLLILDNCEHVLEARAVIAQLLETCPHLTILATSREPLGLAHEAVIVVPALATLDDRMLAVDEHLEDYPAVTLFIEYARLLQGDLTLTPVLIRTIARICAQLDGIPLAIELAAARMETLPPQTILAQLSGPSRRRFFDLPRKTRSHAPARQQTLRDALAWSYQLLDAREQIVFRRASVFAGGWTSEAAEALGDPHHLLGINMPSVLTSLVNKSLVQQEIPHEADGTPHYKMHYVMRAYGKELLTERKEERAVYQQLSDYYVRLVEDLEQQLTGAGQAESLRRLVAEYENIRVVLQWAREQQAIATGLRISASLWWFWENRGYLTEGREWVEGMLALWERQPQAADTEIAARAYYGAAILAVTQGDIEHGTVFAEASLKYMRSANKRARVLLMLGNLAKRRNDAAGSLRLYTEGLAMLRELDDPKGMVVALNNLSTLYIERGDWQQALPLLEESIALKRALGDQRGVAVGLMNQGEALKAQGQYAEALATTQAGLEIFHSLGDSQGEALAHNNLGEISEASGDDARAIAAYSESLATYRRIEDRPGIAMTLQHLGHLHARRHEREGIAYLQEAASIYEELGNATGTEECRRDLAAIHTDTR